jgi:hypothetical protein
LSDVNEEDLNPLKNERNVWEFKMNFIKDDFVWIRWGRKEKNFEKRSDLIIESSWENLLKTQSKTILKDSSNNGKLNGIFSINLKNWRNSWNSWSVGSVVKINW